jgi:hypothetical protein
VKTEALKRENIQAYCFGQWRWQKCRANSWQRERHSTIPTAKQFPQFSETKPDASPTIIRLKKHAAIDSTELKQSKDELKEKKTLNFYFLSTRHVYFGKVQKHKFPFF